MMAISCEGDKKYYDTYFMYYNDNPFCTRRFSDATFHLRGVSCYFVLRFCASFFSLSRSADADF